MKNIRELSNSIDCWLVLVVIIGGYLRFSRLGDFDNQYYTATVASMLQSPSNFFFASFDSGGNVMVDKPPFSFWIQAIPAYIFGVSRWSVTMPQAIAGTAAIIILYMAIRPAFGRIAAISAALILSIVPASVVIDSRNEPDSLLSLALLLAAFCIIRSAQTGNARWLVVSSLLIGIGFNIKMLIAFVPLPAFLLYHFLADRVTIGQALTRTTLSIVILLGASLSWIGTVAIVPPENRPYVGSTQDNSIWTLALKYNGLNRFTSFIGPRQRQPPPVSQPGAIQQGQPLRPPTISDVDVEDAGILGLFANPLSGQFGWLLPLALFHLSIMFVSVIPERVYRKPSVFFELLRESPAASQTILWGGWLTTAVMVFGLANSTTTHPYYLVGMAVPLAAVLGIGFSILWNTFKRGQELSWLLPGMLIGSMTYQIYGSNGLISDWAVAITLGTLLPGVLIMIVAIWRQLTAEPLSIVGVIIGIISVLIIPLAIALTSGSRIAGPSMATQRPNFAATGMRESDPVNTISSFITDQGDSGSVFMVGTVNAREAAPFIIAGFPAIAIGGFSGSDPVFSIESFQSMVEKGELRYFLIQRQGDRGRPSGSSTQDHILNHVRRHWEDVSQIAKLPRDTIYRYSRQQNIR